MLLWINGPFGGGKTHTAFELRWRLPRSVGCDPEQVGFGLHRMTPRPLRFGFQDFPAWRQGVYQVLDLVLTKHEGPVIAPMTLIEPAYFREILGRLRESGHGCTTSPCSPRATWWCAACASAPSATPCSGRPAGRPSRGGSPSPWPSSTCAWNGSVKPSSPSTCGPTGSPSPRSPTTWPPGPAS